MKSDFVKKGTERAPHRSLFNAAGYTDEELERPLIGVVNSFNEIVPGHMNLDKICEAVKKGIYLAGGVPVEIPAIAVCDGIAMNHTGMKYSLVTRELIADSTEAMAEAHQFDGLVMIPNCDKNVPGLLRAAARVNVPTIFVSGGPMLAGRKMDGKRTCLSSLFEAVGQFNACLRHSASPHISCSLRPGWNWHQPQAKRLQTGRVPDETPAPAQFVSAPILPATESAGRGIKSFFS